MHAFIRKELNEYSLCICLYVEKRKKTHKFQVRICDVIQK